MKIFLYKPELLFVKETDTFGHIVVWTTYTSHIDHFTPQHTAFEQSVTCLLVFLELLPGMIPLTMLWHAGWTLEKTICMNMTYNYSTTIFRSILTHILSISGIIYKFYIWPWKIHKPKLKIYIFLPDFCTFWAKKLNFGFLFSGSLREVLRYVVWYWHEMLKLNIISWIQTIVKVSP